MRRLLLVLGSISALLLLSEMQAYACGDKLLALNRGPRFRDFSSSHRASILIYNHTGSTVASALDQGQLQSALVKGGHRLQLVGERKALDEALKTGHYDIVLVDLTDVRLVEDSLRTAPSSPQLVPVVYRGTNDENRSLERQYRFVLKAPDKSGNYLNAIDRVLDEKDKQNRTALRRN